MDLEMGCKRWAFRLIILFVFLLALRLCGRLPSAAPVKTPTLIYDPTRDAYQATASAVKATERAFVVTREAYRATVIVLGKKNFLDIQPQSVVDFSGVEIKGYELYCKERYENVPPFESSDGALIQFVKSMRYVDNVNLEQRIVSLGLPVAIYYFLTSKNGTDIFLYLDNRIYPYYYVNGECWLK